MRHHHIRCHIAFDNGLHIWGVRNEVARVDLTASFVYRYVRRASDQGQEMELLLWAIVDCFDASADARRTREETETPRRR